ncbi:MAG: head GIN domain-containing protein [Massilia sp.]
MNKLLGTALLATTLSVAAHNAVAAEMASENRTVDARVTKVKLGGVVDLRIKQGATPSLVVWGDRDDLAKVSTTQNGDTLQIDTERHRFHWGRDSHKVRADLTVPNLAEFVSQGVGGTDVSGFAGDSLKLSLDGAGAVTLNGRYRTIDARLGGVGGLTLNTGDAERIDLSLRGAGQITARGQAKVLRARLAGVGSLDAQELRADAVDLDLSGLGGASVFAKTSANVNLNGMGSAKVYGNPATRKATSNGMGKVQWQ